MLLLVLACLATDPKGRFLNDYPVQVGELKLDFAEVRGVATVRAVKVNKLGLPTIYKFATGPGRRKFDFEKIVRMPSGKSSVNCYGYAELDGRNIEVQQNGPSNRYLVRGIGDDDSMRRSYFGYDLWELSQCPMGV